MNNDSKMQQLLEENARLSARLQEAEDTLQAIREGAVDALVVQGPSGDQIFTLSGEEIIYRRLVETMNEAGLTTTPDGIILFCNTRFSQLVKLPMERVVGMPLEQFVHPLSRISFDRLMQGVRRAPVKQRLVLAQTGGQSVPVLISASLLRQGDSVYVCLVAADMTELEAKNSELEKRADQLSRLVSELTLTEKRERHRLAAVLHDHLQQLLVGAIFALEAFGRQTDEESRRSLGDIRRLIEESLEVSRSLTVELSPTILHEAGLEGGLNWLAGWMKQKHGLTVDLDCSPHIAVERQDLRILLFESVRELLFNIVKHAGVERANVCVCSAENELRIVVSDRGKGFDSEMLNRNIGSAGSRFGLFSIRERLELIGGRLIIEASPQKGAAFTLLVPQRTENKAAVPVPPAPNTASRTVPSAAAAGNKIRIVVADDHAVVRQGLCTLLLCEPQLELVGQACNGEQAVEMARQLCPDIVLMDCSMPKLNGPDATRTIRSELPQVRVVGLSMYDQADRGTAMLEAGACAYLSKDGDFRKLVNTICGIHSAAQLAPQP